MGFDQLTRNSSLKKCLARTNSSSSWSLVPVTVGTITLGAMVTDSPSYQSLLFSAVKIQLLLKMQLLTPRFLGWHGIVGEVGEVVLKTRLAADDLLEEEILLVQEQDDRYLAQPPRIIIVRPGLPETRTVCQKHVHCASLACDTNVLLLHSTYTDDDLFVLFN